MPSDNFEKSLQRRFQSVEIPPRPEVWEGIQTKLAEPKWHQRGKWLWSLAAIGVILLCLSAYWMMTSPYGPQQAAEGNTLTGVEQESSPPTVVTPLIEESPDKDIMGESESSSPSPLPLKAEGASPTSILPNKSISSSDAPPSLNPAKEQDLGASREVLPTNPDLAGGDRTVENSGIGTKSAFIPVKYMDPQMSVGLSEGVAIAHPSVSMQMDQFTGSPHPGPSKWAFGFYLRPELPWYTSASVSLEQEPPRSTEIDDPIASPEMSDVDGMIVNQDKPSLVFYEITYARSALSAGFTFGYYVNPKLSLHTGLGIFSSGSHRLVPMNPSEDMDTAYNRGNTAAANSPSEFSDRNLQLEIPLLAQYTFASDKSSWVIKGGISVNQNLRKGQSSLSGDESNINFLSSTESILTQKPTNLHAEVGILYRFHLNSKLNLYVGPTQTYGLSPVYTTQHGKSIYLNRLALQMGIELR